MTPDHSRRDSSAELPDIRAMHGTGEAEGPPAAKNERLAARVTAGISAQSPMLPRLHRSTFFRGSIARLCSLLPALEGVVSESPAKARFRARPPTSLPIPFLLLGGGSDLSGRDASRPFGPFDPFGCAQGTRFAQGARRSRWRLSDARCRLIFPFSLLFVLSSTIPPLRALAGAM